MTSSKLLIPLRPPRGPFGVESQLGAEEPLPPPFCPCVAGMLTAVTL